jgi:phosphate-selective porin OprO/OprP
VFDENANDDPGALALGTAFAARATFNPIMSDGRIVHLGASAQHREAEDGDLFRYRARPGIHLSDRFVDTGAVADSDSFLGAEAAYIAGRFHVAGEYGVLSTEGPAADGDLWGAYVEGGVFLTEGDSKGYRAGVFDRTRPVRSIDEGGIGAWELRARVDRLDLDDDLIAGGEQTSYTVGVNWYATDYLRFLAEATRSEVENGPDGSGDVDSASVRAAIDW